MTRKATSLLILALILYFFANQTQVGWLYVMSALLTGLVLTARYFNRRMLRHITAERLFEPDTADLREGDSITTTLKLASHTPSYQLLIDDISPLADPETELHHQKHFLPQLTADPITLRATTEVYRRGLHTFPPLQIATSAPFALFNRQQTIANPEATVLVYPELRPLTRVSLFEKRPSVQTARPQAGLGSEVMGVRPYRSGDSPRHIHWRSVARTGRLISKEFVDETEPGLALVIDNTRPIDPTSAQRYRENKHNPFETAVKIAASLGDYALRHGYPLHLIYENSPRGPLTADMLWQALARLEPNAERPFSENLSSLSQTFVAAILPYPSETAVGELISLAQRGHTVRVYLLDTASYPDHSHQASLGYLADLLAPHPIEIKSISFGDNWVQE